MQKPSICYYTIHCFLPLWKMWNHFNSKASKFRSVLFERDCREPLTAREDDQSDEIYFGSAKLLAHS